MARRSAEPRAGPGGAAGPDAQPPIPAEREVKLTAAPAFRMPDLSGIADGVQVGPPREARLETTYYDTADLRLARWGLSLRHRGGEGWTLKLPGVARGAMLTRGELVFPGPARRPPDEAVALVRAYLRGLPLEAVARLSTRRRLVPLAGDDGRPLAEIADDEVSVLHGRRVAARFREVEVELKGGGDAVLAPLLERLSRAGAVPARPVPKHVRALGPAALEPPEIAVGDLPAQPGVEEVVRSALAAAAALVLRHDPLVRVGGDPEDVHQARVGTRRLRSNLRTFLPLLDPTWAGGLRAELGWLAGELGLVRDREVLLERLRELAARLPEADARPAAALIARLAAGVESGRRELLEAMSTQRYFDLVDRLVEAASRPALSEAGLRDAASPASGVLPGLAVKPWRDLRRAVRALGREPADADLHRVRIFAKRARYAAEAVVPAAGRPAARFARLAAELQTVLGEHQDSVTAQAWLRASAGSGRGAFVAGELCALEAARAEEARRRWRAAWARLDRPGLRAWMTAA